MGGDKGSRKRGALAFPFLGIRRPDAEDGRRQQDGSDLRPR